MTHLPALARALHEALGAEFGVGLTDPAVTSVPPLWPEEEAATARMVEARRREFAAGRAAARAAMADLGLPPAPLPMGADRAPVWPARLSGSISHCTGAAVALVARRDTAPALGIDIEEDTPLEAELWPEILTVVEQDWLMHQPERMRGRHAKEIFSAKEAVHKAQYPLTGHMLGFDEVTLTLDGRSFRAQLQQTTPALPEMIAGYMFRIGSFVLSAAIVTQAEVHVAQGKAVIGYHMQPRRSGL